MKATEQYVPVVLLIMLYLEVVTFECVDQTLTFDPLSESYRAVHVLSYGAVDSESIN